MKKIFALLTVLTLILACVPAPAESPASPRIVGSLEDDGSYVVRISLDPGDTGEWNTARIDSDPSAVKTDGQSEADGVLTVRYVPVQDGQATVYLRHFTSIACDELHTINLVVKDGRILEPTGGSYTASPDEDELDAHLSGGWLEEQTQFTSMTIRKNPGGGWDAEVISPLTHGAWVFRATFFYDCEQDALVYQDGTLWDLSTEGLEASLRSEPAMTGAAGCFNLSADEKCALVLTWTNPRAQEETVRFAFQNPD